MLNWLGIMIIRTKKKLRNLLSFGCTNVQLSQEIMQFHFILLRNFIKFSDKKNISETSQDKPKFAKLHI